MKPSLPVSELREALMSLRRFFKLSLLFSLFTNLLALAPTLYMLEVYGRVVNSRNTETLLMLTVLVIGAYLVMEFVDWVRNEMLHAAGVRLDRNLGARVFNAAFEARLRGLPIGATPFNDLRTLRAFLTSPASTAIMDAPISLLFVVVIFAMSVPLGSVVLVAALVMLAIGFATERKTRPPMRDAQKIAMESQRYATSTLKNAQVIEAMGMVGQIRKRWLERQRQFLAKQAEASDHAGLGAAASKFIQVAQSSAVLGFAAWLQLVGELSPTGSVMIVAWILSSRALAPLNQLIGQWKTVVAARETYARLEGLLATLPVSGSGMPLPPPEGALSVEALVAGAPGTNTAILRGVTFAMAPGQVLAVVGPSASGKSTLARLLVGIWPAASGKVRLDGVDIYTWNKQELGPHVGYLPQENELFDGSFAENIARFGEVDLEKVQAAARAVGLHDLVAALPDGYDTQIGAGGNVLPGGHRQRVALARAIYNDPKLVVLDEPNSSLDEAGERALVQTLLQLKARGATTIVITHRTNVLEAVDRILVLRDGQMQALGPRDEVLAALAGGPKTAPAAAPALAAV
jgi:ATP-binding cassette subfamily C exporter for protease/lipase